MKTHLTLCLLVWATSVARAAEPDPLAPMDDALRAVAAFEYGNDPSPLELVEQIVVASASKPELRANVEERLARSLSGPGTRDGKEFICRQLFTIGTARSIPQLEALLTDPGLSHIARYALGRNPDVRASAALQRALLKTSGDLQAGIVNTLGDRRYRDALPDLARLLRSPEVNVAEAAATALGNIGGADAVSALEAAQGRAHEPVHSQIDFALLACANRFVREGQDVDAVRILETFYAPDQPRYLRIAALHGLAVALKEKALPTLVAAITGPDPDLCAAAIGFSGLVPGAESTKRLATLLTGLSVTPQLLLLNALGNRCDNVAAPAVAALVKSPQDVVRAAACQALGTLGGVGTLDLLLHSAAYGTAAEQQAARASLQSLDGREIDTALANDLRATDPKVVSETVRALAGRKATSTFSPLLTFVRGVEPGKRQEGVRALGALVDESHLGELVELAVTFKDMNDIAAWEEAVIASFRRIRTPAKQATPLLVVLPRASAEAKPAVIRLLGATAAPEALATLRAALTDPSPPVAEAAVRALAEWPDAAPAQDLLGLMGTKMTVTSKVVALRGYVRMAGLSKDPLAMYARALGLAQQPEERKLVLGSLANAEPGLAIGLVEPYLRDEALRPEAAQVMVLIADRLRQKDAPRAKAAILNVVNVSTDQATRQQAREVLNQIEALEDYLLDWDGAGPFQEKDKDAHALFDTVFPPEQANATGVKWAHLRKGIGAWEVNLADALGGGDDVVGYARTRVWSPAAQDARLEMGSDDGLKVWLNGVVVHTNNTERGLTPRQDVSQVKLKEGWNDLLLKVTNRGGGWAFACRVRRPDGGALADLKSQAE